MEFNFLIWVCLWDERRSVLDFQNKMRVSHVWVVGAIIMFVAINFRFFLILSLSVSIRYDNEHIHTRRLQSGSLS